MPYDHAGGGPEWTREGSAILSEASRLTSSHVSLLPTLVNASGAHWPFRRRAFRGKLARMFVIELEYIADLTQIDARMREHVVWLKKHYAAGRFLVSGRKIPRDGGIILAVGESREQIERLVQDDPFVSHGLARARVIEFRASQRAKNIDQLIK